MGRPKITLMANHSEQRYGTLDGKSLGADLGETDGNFDGKSLGAALGYKNGNLGSKSLGAELR